MGEQDRLLYLFEANVLHPRASNLVVFADHEPGPEHEGRSLTAEEVVDHALVYKPIELGRATE